MKNPGESGGEEEAGSVEEQPGNEAVVRVQREEIEVGGKGIRSLKERVVRECCISKEGTRLNNEGIQAGGVQGGSHSDSRCGISSRGRGAALGVIAAKSSEFRGE